MPPSKPDRTSLDAVDEMLLAYPVQVRAIVEKLLRGLGITNNDDPVLKIIILMGVFGTYFEKIPALIVAAGEAVKKQISEALQALDTRLVFLRSVAVTLQQATDRLENAPQEIVNKFPSQKIADALEKKVSEKLDTLQLKQFEKSIQSLNTNMALLNNSVSESQRWTQRQTLEIQAKAVEKDPLTSRSSSSWWGVVGALVVGIIIGAGLVWVTCVLPLTMILHNQGFIGTNAMAGEDENGTPCLYISKDKIERVGHDPAGNWKVLFKAEPTPTPTPH